MWWRRVTRMVWRHRRGRHGGGIVVWDGHVVAQLCVGYRTASVAGGCGAGATGGSRGHGGRAAVVLVLAGRDCAVAASACCC